jgi:hypothetical protein
MQPRAGLGSVPQLWVESLPHLKVLVPGVAQVAVSLSNVPLTWSSLGVDSEPQS